MLQVAPGTTENDERWMRYALELAEAAAAAGEVPVGAVVVRDGELIGEGRNECAQDGNPLRHAEIVALEAAFRATGDARLPGVVVYCTLEPCFMCTGALLHARVARIVYGAADPKFGACESLARLPSDTRLNHRCPSEGGLLADESAALLRAFFAARRS